MRSGIRPASRSPSPPPSGTPNRALSLRASPAASPRGSPSAGNPVLEQSRALLQGLRAQAEKTSSPQNKAAFKKVAAEVEEKINVLQQQLENSRQNSPAASPRAIAGSLERYDLKRGASPRGVNRKLDLSSYNSSQPNATCISWSFSIVLSFLNEVAPYALVCALTGMLARSGPPAMPVSVTQLGAFAAVLATTQFGCGLLYTLVVSVFVSHLQSAVADRAWGCVGKRMWYSVIIALICGAVSGGAMFALEQKIYDVLALTPAARLASSPYFRARCAALAPVMALRVVLSIYEAFNRRMVGAALNVVASVLEACLAFHMLFNLRWGLEGVGIASISASAVVAVLGLFASPFLQPPDARCRIKFFRSTPVLSHVMSLCFGSKYGDRSSLLLDDSTSFAPPIRLSSSIALGLDGLLRFISLQGTIMAATILASQIGEGALVANHIALLVWMSTCPLIDGLSVVFAPTTAELLYGGHYALLKRHVYQVVASGLIVGCVFAFSTWALKPQILAVLMGPDPADVSIGANLNLIWTLISAMQLVNALGSLYDGLLFASHHFSFVRNQLLFGLVVVFAPALVVLHNKMGDMYGIWGALALYSGWRFVVSALKVHWCISREWGLGSVSLNTYANAQPQRSPRSPRSPRGMIV